MIKGCIVVQSGMLLCGARLVSWARIGNPGLGHTHTDLCRSLVIGSGCIEQSLPLQSAPVGYTGSLGGRGCVACASLQLSKDDR